MHLFLCCLHMLVQVFPVFVFGLVFLRCCLTATKAQSIYLLSSDVSSALDPSHKQSRLSQPSSGKSRRILHRPTGPVNTFWPPSLYTVLALPGRFAVPGLAGKTMSSQASWPPSPLVTDLPGHFGPHHCTQCWLFQAAWPPSFAEMALLLSLHEAY